MDRLKNILVAVDFSEGSKVALAQGARIAGWSGATLHVCHVIESLVLHELSEHMPGTDEEVEADILSDARKHLEAWVADAGSAPKNVQLSVEVGAPIDQLIRKVVAVSAELLVLGERGEGHGGSGVGTVASKAVQKAPTKVLLVAAAHDGAFEKVVACLDFSDTAREALAQAAEVAKHDGALLHMLHTFRGPWTILHYQAPTPEASPDFQLQYTTALESRLEACRDELIEKHPGLQVECVLRQTAASYGRAIVAYAKDEDADLVVLGAQGRTNLRYVFLGSTAERVLRETDCSVLVLKPAGFSIDTD